MDYRKMHVAKAGAKTGQWVECDASKPERCRNGGVHIEKQEVNKIQTWAGRRAVVDVTMQDYVDYRQSELAGTLTTTQRAMETLAEKRARLDKDGNGRITKAPEERKKQPGTLLRENIAKANDYLAKNPTDADGFLERYYADYPKWKEYDKKKLIDLAKTVTLECKSRPSEAVKTVQDAINNGRFPTKLEDIRSVIPATSTEIALKRKQKEANEILEFFSNKPVDDSKSPVCKAANPNQCPHHGNRVQNTPPAVPLRGYNQIADYKPLNEGTSAEVAMLAQLKAYRGERGAMGRVPRRTKILEFMVHNQIVFKPGSYADSYKLERRSVTYYAGNFESLLKNTTQAVDSFTNEEGRSFQRGLEDKLVRFLEEHSHNESVKQNIHDEFVRSSKTSLLTTIVNKGHERSDIALRVASAKRASEIYQLEKEVNVLKNQDEFTAAGL